VSHIKGGNDVKIAFGSSLKIRGGKLWLVSDISLGGGVFPRNDRQNVWDDRDSQGRGFGRMTDSRC